MQNVYPDAGDRKFLAWLRAAKLLCVNIVEIKENKAILWQKMVVIMDLRELGRDCGVAVFSYDILGIYKERKNEDIRFLL
ncbi:MAG: hypothetical protein ACLUL2_03965 [Blautia sp.]